MSHLFLLNNHFASQIHFRFGSKSNSVDHRSQSIHTFLLLHSIEIMSLISSFFDEFVPFLLRNSQFDLAKCQNAAKQHTEKLKQNGDIGFPTSMKAWSHASDVPLTQKIVDEQDTELQAALLEISRKWSFPIRRIQCSDNRCLLFLERTKCFENVLMNVLNDKQDFGRWKQPMESEETFNVGLSLHSNNDSLTELRCTLIQNVLVKMLTISGYRVVDDVNQSTVRLIVSHPRSDNDKRQNGNVTEATIEARKITCGQIKSQENLTATEYIQSVLSHNHLESHSLIDICYGFLVLQVPCQRHGKDGRHEKRKS